jgi:hypothetical protein
LILSSSFTHWVWSSAVGVSELLLAGNELQLKAREAELDWNAFGRWKMPAIVELVDGEFWVVGGMRGGRIPLTRRGGACPGLCDREGNPPTISDVQKWES